MGDNPWQQFSENKEVPVEVWRSGSCANVFQEVDVCWMTTFCTPCMIGREWAGVFELKSYDNNMGICLAACLCPIVQPFLTCKLRGGIRRIGDATTDKSDVKSHIPGSTGADCLLSFCCMGCTICHVGRELKHRNMPPGTLCK